jgi:putative membrane protein
MFFAFAQTQAHAIESDATLSDGQIAKVLVTLDAGEIKIAKIAKRKTRNNDVKDFAKMMIDQHKQNKQDTQKLAKKEDLKLADSDLNQSLQDECEASGKELKKSASFDKDYADLQVSMHQKALDILDKTLIPQAKNAALRTHLESTRTTVSTHLDDAKALQSKLE